MNQGLGQYETVQQIPITAPEGVRFVPDDASGDAVLVIAGSSGRVDVDRARVFAEHGFIAESIRWFGGPGQHAGPWEVPLECFFDRIVALESVSDRVWVVGTSLGAEAALLIAAKLPSVAGVIAFAPSDVVWSWTDDAGTERSHWTLAGSPAGRWRAARCHSCRLRGVATCVTRRPGSGRSTSSRTRSHQHGSKQLASLLSRSNNSSWWPAGTIRSGRAAKVRTASVPGGGVRASRPPSSPGRMRDTERSSLVRRSLPEGKRCSVAGPSMPIAHSVELHGQRSG
ncbi:hypothetical protein EDF42_3378 [Curtobacterium sp. PhB172]|nr:hypothetical protein EDF42_3378 [Curtobacterium sp. PhB172]